MPKSLELNMDIITAQGAAEGDVAARIMMGGLDIHSMRPWIAKNGKTYVSVYDEQTGKLSKRQLQTNGLLRRDEWKALDDAVMGVSEKRLGGIQDLIDKNLIYNLGDAFGTTVLEWHDVSDALEAEMTMDGVHRSKNDRVKYQVNYLPIPIIHVDYELNLRFLAASRKMGNPMDTTLAERASRKIWEYMEDMLFTDKTYSYGEKDDRVRNTIYSYTNFPDRNLLKLSLAWDNSAKTGQMIIADVQAMKKKSMSKHKYGPWFLYIPANYETAIDEDYDSTTPGTTIRERILKIGGIEQIKVSDTLADDNVLLVQMTPDNVRLVRGLGIQNVQWDTEGKFINKNKVLTIQVPQIRSDQEGNCGIVHMS